MPYDRTKPRGPRLKIEISQEIIDTGFRKDSRHCVIAEAIRAQVPNAINITVDLQTIRWSDREKGLRYTFLTPRPAQQALVYYDRGIRIRSFSFSLRGATIVPMIKQARDGKRYRAHNLGPRQLNSTPEDDRKGCIPEVVGGKYPPRQKNAAHAHNRREFGLRAFTKDDVVPMPDEVATNG